jgi:hypothetical protein
MAEAARVFETRKKSRLSRKRYSCAWLASAVAGVPLATARHLVQE